MERGKTLDSKSLKANFTLLLQYLSFGYFGVISKNFADINCKETANLGRLKSHGLYQRSYEIIQRSRSSDVISQNTAICITLLIMCCGNDKIKKMNIFFIMDV